MCKHDPRLCAHFRRNMHGVHAHSTEHARAVSSPTLCHWLLAEPGPRDCIGQSWCSAERYPGVDCDEDGHSDVACVSPEGFMTKLSSRNCAVPPTGPSFDPTACPKLYNGTRCEGACLAGRLLVLDDSRAAARRGQLLPSFTCAFRAWGPHLIPHPTLCLTQCLPASS